MEKWWGFTKGWKHRPDLDEPELKHTCGDFTFPQFCGFEDSEGQTHLISRFMALALGLVGLKDVPKRKMTFAEWGRRKPS